MLTCQSQADIENVNLMATLLSHDQMLAYWKHLGRRCMADVKALLQRHLLGGILGVPWIHPATGKKADDTQFFSALQELMTYAFDEYARLEKASRNQAGQSTFDRPGILVEMQALLRHYRAELLAQSVGLRQERAK